MKIAVIDIGTNSVRMMVAEKDYTIKIKASHLVTTRLGQGSADTGCLSVEAMDRTIAALLDFRDKLHSELADQVVLIATSAVREASNQAGFVHRVKEETGWKVNVIPGEEEANLGYLGVINGLPDVPAEPVVIDIGGGSTELIFTVDGHLQYTSTRIGAVYATEKQFDYNDIKGILAPVLAKIKKFAPTKAVGIGGTATTLAAVDLALEQYSPEMVHGYKLSANTITQIYQKLAGMSLEQRKQLKGLQPARADIILAGITILNVILSELQIPQLIISETDIMYGVAYKHFYG